MLFTDRLTLDAPHRTSDGYLVTRARAARTGVYQYAGREVDPENKHGLRDQALVNVLRDDKTVFDKVAVHSFIGKPITSDHPSVAVNADNWRDHARGVVMGALKDGEHLSFDLLLTDATAISDVEGGKRELSNGYAAELQFGDFTAADGTKCPVRQAKIRGNHVAIVDCGRAGPECRIADAAPCTSLPADVFELLTDERTYSGNPNDNKNRPARNSGGSPVATKTILIDGYQFEADAALEVAITKLQNQLKDTNDAKTKAEGERDQALKDKATLEGEKVVLEQKAKDAGDPAKLEQKVKDRAELIAQAKAIEPKVVTDSKSDAEIRKAVVEAKLGDAAKDMDEPRIAGAFLALAKDVKTEQRDPVRDVLSSGVRTAVNDSGASVRDLARAAQF
jgi:hypothetical protein